MIPYVGYDPNENRYDPNKPRGPQANGPAQQNLTPPLVRRSLKIQRAHPDWSYRMVGAELGRRIGRYPPFTGEAIGQRLRPLLKEAPRAQT